MKHTCATCGGTELYEIDQVCFEAPDSINAVVPLAFFAHYGAYGGSGWMGEKKTRLAINASARICGGCGRAELFTKDLENLKRLVSDGVEGIRRL